MATGGDQLDNKVHSMFERLLDVGLEASLDDARLLRVGVDAALEILAPQVTQELEHVPQPDVVVIN